MFSGVAHAMGANPNATMQEQLLNGFVPIIAIIVIFYFMLIRPQQKKAKAHQAMQDSLKPGDRIVTSGGFFGRVIEIDGNEVTIDLGETKAKVARAALTILPDASASQGRPAKEAKKDKEKK